MPTGEADTSFVQPAKCTRVSASRPRDRCARHQPCSCRRAHPRRPFADIPMTDVTTQEDWDPGRRRDLARPAHRSPATWLAGVPAQLSGAASRRWRSPSSLFLAIDGLLISRYRRYQRETHELRASMSDVERKRTDEILAQNENRLKVMVELFKRQAKVDPTLHLSVSLDSSVMYLQREGALLREMPITVGPERRVGTPPDTVHIAAPRGKRTVEAGARRERRVGRARVGLRGSRPPGRRDAPEGRTRTGGGSTRRRDGDLLAAERRSAQRFGVRPARRDSRSCGRSQSDRPEPSPGVAVYFY